MYRFNTIGVTTLITVDEVVAVAAISETFDVRIIQNSIKTTEIELIVPLLGQALYNAISAQKNVVVTSGNQTALIADINNQPNPPAIPVTTQTLPIGSVVNAIEFVTTGSFIDLWNKFLWQAVAEAVDLRVTSHSRVRHTAQGQQVNDPNNVSAGSGAKDAGLKNTEWKMDKAINQRVNPLFDAVSDYICFDTTGAFTPYFNPCKCQEVDGWLEWVTDGQETRVSNTGSIVLGIYEDKDRLVSLHNRSTKDKAQIWDSPVYYKWYNGFPIPSPDPTPIPNKTTKTLQFTCIDGQTMYPYVGQTDEAAILEALNGATLITLSLNGVLLTQGTADGDVIGFVGSPQRIEWVTPSAAGTAGILIFNN